MRRARALAGGAHLAIAGAAAPARAEPLSGSVVDGLTLEPIAGATVTAPGGASATTDKAGHFHFDDVPAGPLDLALAAKGYDASTEQITIPEGGLADSIFVLYTPGASGEVVNVTDRAPVPPAPGKQDLPREEISRIPGTRGDALQSIRSLPGVSQAGPPGFLIVRGAAPLDTKVNIDGVEVPIVYHFFGIQSVFPTEFIQDIEF